MRKLICRLFHKKYWYADYCGHYNGRVLIDFQCTKCRRVWHEEIGNIIEISEKYDKSGKLNIKPKQR